MRLRLRFTPSAWEVVHHAQVEPIFMYDDDELDDFDISDVSRGDTWGTYVFDMKKKVGDIRGAVLFSRQLLLEEVGKKNFNVLLFEGWRLTLLRKGKKHRIEVRYCGRAALASGKLPPQPPPPFLGVLDSCKVT
ncbi:hypothetical protein JAAARDRAFT_394165 [Jaapia argillacea MUCL 33604]|uniref:Uncharacterized protein n=1 Tax=Jaapia argillacea MUCL 33604 TaxID=933084 RepID=A0A067Q9Y7_9AGAM|nr:hypothetical protein JAAARDRAFT_394165 [Jaapia argillacea MUCL 33604]